MKEQIIQAVIDVGLASIVLGIFLVIRKLRFSLVRRHSIKKSSLYYTCLDELRSIKCIINRKSSKFADSPDEEKNLPVETEKEKLDKISERVDVISSFLEHTT